MNNLWFIFWIIYVRKTKQLGCMLFYTNYSRITSRIFHNFFINYLSSIRPKLSLNHHFTHNLRLRSKKNPLFLRTFSHF